MLAYQNMFCFVLFLLEKQFLFSLGNNQVQEAASYSSDLQRKRLIEILKRKIVFQRLVEVYQVLKKTQLNNSESGKNRFHSEKLLP